MISGDCQCPARCGRPADRNGPPGTVYSQACFRRWERAGHPDSGAPATRKVTGDCQCSHDCGRLATTTGPGGLPLSDTCYQRWRRAGRPAVVPPPGKHPKPPAEPPPPELDVEPDPAEVAARWGWVDPELRRSRAIPAAAELVNLVQRRDRQGVEILMSRFTDWGAIAIILAGWVDPAQAVKEAKGRNAA